MSRDRGRTGLRGRWPGNPDHGPFLVVASQHGKRLQITAGSALAAAAAAQYWRDHGLDEADWLLRDDVRHHRPVLLFTRHQAGPMVHVTELIAGKPVSAHPLTCCDLPLRWDVMQVCTQEMAEPCPDCLTAIRSAGLFSHRPQCRTNHHDAG